MMENEAFSFTLEDLGANSAGRITEIQMTRLQEVKKASVKGHVMGGLAILFTVSLMAGIALNNGGPDSSQFFFTALTAGIFVLIYGAFTILAVIRSRDIRTGEISTAEGKLEVKRVENRYGTVFTARVGGLGFRLMDEVQFTNLKDHSYCRIYYIKNPPVHLILSVEFIG